MALSLTKNLKQGKKAVTAVSIGRGPADFCLIARIIYFIQVSMSLEEILLAFAQKFLLN